MTKRFFLLCGLLLALSTAAEQLKLPTLQVAGTTYSNVTVLGANATDLYFSHSQGFANVKLKYLSPDLQKRFDYNAKAAEEAERKQNEADILYQTALVKKSLTQSSSTATTPKPVIGSETGLSDPISEKSLLGKQLPKLDVDKWLGDKPSLDGKYVLISFWAPWSVPCKQSIPELNALQKKYADKLVVVGVTADSENAVSDMTEPKMDYVCGIDAKAKVSAAAGVINIPCIVLSDPKGVVLYQGHPGALTDKKLQAILARPTE